MLEEIFEQRPEAMKKETKLRSGRKALQEEKRSGLEVGTSLMSLRNSKEAGVAATKAKERNGVR